MKILLTPHRFPGIVLILLMLVFSCKKDPVQPQHPINPSVSKVSFEKANFEVQENSAEFDLEIIIQPKTTKATTLSIKVEELNAAFQKDYLTFPGVENGKITLSVPAGAEKVNLQFKAIDKAENDLQQRQIVLTLERVENSPLKPEGVTTTTITMKDGEINSTISFQFSDQLIYEHQSEGAELKILLEPAASKDGFIDISVATGNATFGKHFTTQPALVEGKQRLWVAKGAKWAILKVFPVDDYAWNEDRILKIFITGGSQHFTPGAQKQMDFTIRDNGRIQRLSLGAVRQSFKGQPLVFVMPVSIHGRVISTNDNLRNRVLFIEDETGGMAIEFESNHQVSFGHTVTIKIENAVLSEKEGVLTISHVDKNGVISHGVEPWTVPNRTLQQLRNHPEILEGTMVTLEDVYFAQGGSQGTMSGDIRITSEDGRLGAYVRTEPFASWSHQTIPAGKRSVTGILIWAGNEKGYVILPQFVTDIR